MLPLLATIVLCHAPTPGRAQDPAPADSARKEGWRLLASDTKGILAISVSGERTRLFESPTSIDSVAYDRSKELTWFVSDKRLWVLDLRAESYRPVLIATGLPVVEFEISGWSSVSAGLDDYDGAGRYNLDLHRYPIITLQPEPKVEVGEAGDADRPENAVSPALIKRIALVGTRWLKEQSRRPNAPSPAKLPDPRRVALPKGDAYGCEESSLCGSSSHLGRTGLELVIARHSCGDGCYTDCLLYDRKSKRFAAPATGAWGKSPEPFSCKLEVAPDDAQYFVSRSHCQVANRIVSCREYDGLNLLGWVASKPTPPSVPSDPGDGGTKQPTPERYVQDMIAAARAFDRETFKAAARLNDPWVERFLPPDELWRAHVACPGNLVPRGSRNQRLWEVLQRTVDVELIRVDPPKRTKDLHAGDTHNYYVGDTLHQCRVVRDFRRVEVELFVRNSRGEERDTDWWLYEFGGRYYFQDE